MADPITALQAGQITVAELAALGHPDALALLDWEPEDAGEFIEPTPEDREWWWHQNCDLDPPPDGGGGGGEWVPMVPPLPWLSPIGTMMTLPF